MARKGDKSYERALATAHNRYGIGENDWDMLLRNERTLHRWCEEECNGTIQREGDEQLSPPYRYSLDQYGTPTVKSARPIRDAETAALRQLTSWCAHHGLSFYYQTDPRGCALYIYRESELEGRPIDECYSTRALAVCY